MPIYAYRCPSCETSGEVFRPLSQYNDMPVCGCGEQTVKMITPLHIMGDIQPFVSPIDNKPVTSRKQLREHCKIHDVVQLGNDMPKPKKRYEPSNQERVEDIKKVLAQHGVN